VSIEFECLNCQAVLRAPLQKGGEFIHCPICDESLQVPLPSRRADSGGFYNSFESELAERMQPMSERRLLRETAPSSFPVEVEPDTWFDETESPECCGKCGKALISNVLRCAECTASRWNGGQHRASFERILSESWKVYTKNLAVCFLVGAVDLVATVLGFFLVLALAFACSAIVQVEPALAVGVFAVIFVLGMVLVSGSLAAGNFRIFLAIAREEPTSAGHLLRMDRHSGKIAVAGTFYWTSVCVGLLCGIIPGVLILGRFWPYGRLIVDHETSLFSASATSWKLTRGHLGTSLGIFLAQFLVILLTAGIPILGPILAFPFVAILYSVTYLSLVEELQDKSPERSVL